MISLLKFLLSALLMIPVVLAMVVIGSFFGVKTADLSGASVILAFMAGGVHEQLYRALVAAALKP